MVVSESYEKVISRMQIKYLVDAYKTLLFVTLRDHLFYKYKYKTDRASSRSRHVFLDVRWSIDVHIELNSN